MIYLKIEIMNESQKDYQKFEIQNYKGFELHVFEPILNPNCRTSQTVLAYLDGEPTFG